jgi:N-acetylglucosamine-6-phosphate deacetylase
MSKLLIKNADIVLPEEILRSKCVLVKDSLITEICDSSKDFEAEQVIDADGKYLCPGLIDLHIHGHESYLIDNGPSDLANICKLLPKYGVTGFLPTVCPLPKGRDSDFVSSLAKPSYEGAKIYGFHLEGPFLKITGALPPEAIGSADPERVDSLVRACYPYKAIFSISPDFERITELIPLMSENGSPVFITHTQADVSQTLKAIEAGACHATHFYDVFYPPDETDPGVRPCGAAEAILADNNVSIDIILDGHHVDPVAVKMFLNCKGSDKVCLITDANIGAGNKPGRYKFGSQEVEIAYPGAPARGTQNSHSPGSLYGSGLTLNRGIKNAVDMLDIELPLAVKMASQNPASVLRLGNAGSIKKGNQADLFLMNKNFEIIQTWVNGKCFYKV